MDERPGKGGGSAIPSPHAKESWENQEVDDLNLDIINELKEDMLIDPMIV